MSVLRWLKSMLGKSSTNSDMWSRISPRIQWPFSLSVSGAGTLLDIFGDDCGGG